MSQQTAGTLAGRYYTVLPRSVELFGEGLSQQQMVISVICTVDWEAHQVEVITADIPLGSWSHALNSILEGLQLNGELTEVAFISISHHTALQLFRDTWLEYADFTEVGEEEGAIIFQKMWGRPDDPEANTFAFTIVIQHHEVMGSEQGVTFFNRAGEKLLYFLLEGARHLAVEYPGGTEDD